MIVKSSTDLKTELVNLIQNYNEIIAESNLLKQLKLMKFFYNIYINKKENKATFGISYDYRRKIVLLNTHIEKDVIKNTIYREELKIVYIEDDNKMVDKIEKIYLSRIKKILSQILDISKNEQNNLFLDGNILLSDTDIARLKPDASYDRGSHLMFVNSRLASIHWDINSIMFLLENKQDYLGYIVNNRQIFDYLNADNLCNFFIAVFQFNGSITDNEFYKFLVHYKYDYLKTMLKLCDNKTKDTLISLINQKDNIISKILGDIYASIFGDLLFKIKNASIVIKNIFDINTDEYHFNPDQNIDIHFYLNSSTETDILESGSIYKVMSPEKNSKMINNTYRILNNYPDHNVIIHFNFKENLNEIIMRLNYFMTFSPSQVIRNKASYVLDAFKTAKHIMRN